ncbi:hypothetical protein [Cellulomonas hominis]
MAVPSDLTETARTIEAGLRRDLAWQLVSQDGDGDAEWFASALTSLVVVVGAQPVRFVAAHGAVDEDELFDAAATIFTDRRVIDIRASTSRWDAPVSWTVEVHPLAGVTRVEVSAAADPWDRSPGAEWPGLVRAAVTFTGGRRIELRPQGPDAEHRAELYALVGLLLDAP